MAASVPRRAKPGGRLKARPHKNVSPPLERERDRLDIAIIARNAKRLHREALDTLEYQRVR